MLEIYNSLTRFKETFKPLHEGHVGMYVCGPTVYGDAHLGHARPAITFDILYRYLQYLGYKVRYVRNITDVGHLEHDADEGEDKIAKKARLEQLEPMEVVQFYTNRYHRDMAALNVLPPSIEPHASGHIIEQIAFVQKILDRGYAYVSNGSVYMDVEKYAKDYPYGKLSGRNLNDIVTETREGEQFDIHGGGLDLIFPHHEAEIAQSCAALGHESVHYWMHNNMITIAGKKMGKSYNNFITLEQFFSGNHPLLSKPFGPMVIRFFILQAHYRSTVDFSSEALEAAEKGLQRMQEAYARLLKIKPSAETTPSLLGEGRGEASLRQRCAEAMDDDLNTPFVIAALFDSAKAINTVHDGKATISEADLKELKEVWKTYAIDILGLRLGDETTPSLSGEGRGEALSAFHSAIDLLLNIRLQAKQNKDWATSDQIRNELTALGFQIKDTKDGFEWSI